MSYYADYRSQMGIDIDGEAEIVAKDVKAGKKANEVSNGRQDVDFDTVAKTRKTNRQHGKASRELPTNTIEHKESDIIELSKDNELSNAIAGTRGAEKYKKLPNTYEMY